MIHIDAYITMFVYNYNCKYIRHLQNGIFLPNSSLCHTLSWFSQTLFLCVSDKLWHGTEDFFYIWLLKPF